MLQSCSTLPAQHPRNCCFGTFWASAGSEGMLVTHSPRHKAGLTGFAICHRFEPGALSQAGHVLPSQTPSTYERFCYLLPFQQLGCQWKLLYVAADPGQDYLKKLLRDEHGSYNSPRPINHPGCSKYPLSWLCPGSDPSRCHAACAACGPRALPMPCGAKLGLSQTLPVHHVLPESH